MHPSERPARERAIIEKFAMVNKYKATRTPIEIYGDRLKEVSTVTKDPVEEATKERQKKEALRL